MFSLNRPVFHILAALVALLLVQSWTAYASGPDPAKLADTLRRLPEAIHDAVVHVDELFDATETTTQAHGTRQRGSRTVQCAFDTAAAEGLISQDGENSEPPEWLDPECVAVFKARKSSATTGGPVPFYTGTGTPIDAGRAWLMVGGAAIAAAALLI